MPAHLVAIAARQNSRVIQSSDNCESVAVPPSAFKWRRANPGLKRVYGIDTGGDKQIKKQTDIAIAVIDHLPDPGFLICPDHLAQTRVKQALIRRQTHAPTK